MKDAVVGSERSGAERPETLARVGGLRILVVEDDADLAAPLAEVLREEGHQVWSCADGSEALLRVEQHRYDLVITDVQLPGLDGISLLNHLHETTPSTAVMVMTAFGSISEAVQTMKRRATHYFEKPFSLRPFLFAVREVEEQLQIERALQRAETHLVASDRDWPLLIGETPQIVALRDRIALIAPTDSAVLIQGETGTGKEVVARSLHAQSARCDRPFVAVNCAAFPDSLLEAELFGHERGAFTGAIQKRVGRIAAAEGGTLFLDEIGDMSPIAQVKLLRVLQEGTYEPLGSNRTCKADVRIVSATHADLRDRIRGKQFREDLFFRIKVLSLTCAPLRDRKADLPLLATHLFREITRAPLAIPRFSLSAWRAMQEHDWPGNVRELAHALESAHVLGGTKQIQLSHLPDEIRGRCRLPYSLENGKTLSLDEALQEFERTYIAHTLAEHEYRRGITAQHLGISRHALWAKMKRLGIDEHEDPAAGPTQDEHPSTPSPRPTTPSGIYRMQGGLDNPTESLLLPKKRLVKH